MEETKNQSVNGNGDSNNDSTFDKILQRMTSITDILIRVSFIFAQYKMGKLFNNTELSDKFEKKYSEHTEQFNNSIKK